jgi:hypothetical protein
MGEDPLNPPSIYRKLSQAPRPGPVATTMSRWRKWDPFGHWPGLADPPLGLSASSFLQQPSNGYLVSYLSTLVQTLPQSGLNIFSRVFQTKNLFSEILYKKVNCLEEF